MRLLRSPNPRRLTLDDFLIEPIRRRIRHRHVVDSGKPMSYNPHSTKYPLSGAPANQ